MKNAIPILAIVAIGVSIAVVANITRKRRLLLYLRRPCTGMEWRHSFPLAADDEIRAFLATFTDAFIFKSKNRLKFSPDDRLMDVYQNIYPPGSISDAMELETFALALERAYGIDLTEIGIPENLTLGQIFEMTKNPNKSP